MSRLNYIIFISLINNIFSAYSSSNLSIQEVPATFSNLTAENDLWLGLLKNCKELSLTCIKNNIYEYLKRTLNYPNDLQFTSFLKFSKNSGYYKTETIKGYGHSKENSTIFINDETPIEEITRSLAGSTIQFFMTHDLEISLPKTFFLGTILKISPRSLEDNGALVKLEIIPDTITNSVEEGRLFKKIRQFISERLIYALLAILLVIKLLAVNLLFVLPTIVGVATAKKLILKVLLFLFPALHHLFKLCAYVPYGAKHHIHKHQIAHIHQIDHDHHHGHHYGPPHEDYIVHEPPSPYHHSRIQHKDFYDPYGEASSADSNDLYYENRFISHKEDQTHNDNDIDAWSHGENVRLKKPVKTGRPLTPNEIETMILKAEKEALIKSRLLKEKQRIHEENIRLQEQLNNALKIQEKLKQQSSIMLSSTLPSLRQKNNIVLSLPSKFHQTPLKESNIASNSVKRNQIEVHLEDQRIPSQFQQSLQGQEKDYQKQHTYVQHQKLQNNIDYFENKKESVKHDMYMAASITYDSFYSPLLDQIDKLLNGLGFQEEPCKERLICSMYKSPTKFSPHSNLLSAVLSRDSKELQKPSSTNAAVLRFYKYVQAARDGQDNRNCINLYPTCSFNPESR